MASPEAQAGEGAVIDSCSLGTPPDPDTIRLAVRLILGDAS